MKIKHAREMFNKIPSEFDDQELMMGFYDICFPVTGVSPRMLTTEDGESFFDRDETNDPDLPSIPSFVLVGDEEEEENDYGAGSA